MTENRNQNGNLDEDDAVEIPPVPETQRIESVSIEVVATLAVDLWKIAARAKGEQAGERIQAACERAEERLRKFGFEIEDVTGREYDTNMVGIKVLEHDGGSEPFTIVQCLIPAIYYRGVLVREAEVITKGI